MAHKKGGGSSRNGRDSKSKRVWLVGSFPYQFEKTGILRNVTVHSFNDGKHPTTKLEARGPPRAGTGTPRGWASA